MLKRIVGFFRDHSLFLRFLGGMILAAFLLVGLISGAMYYVSQRVLTRQLDTAEEQYLGSVGVSIDNYMQMARQTASSLSANTYVQQAILSGNETWSNLMYNCLLAVKQALSSSTLFTGISLISGDKLLLKSERNYQTKAYDDLMISMVVNHIGESAIPWRMNAGRKEYLYLSVPHAVDVLQTPNTLGGVLVTLDMDKLAAQVLSGIVGLFYAVDEQGRVVLSSDGSAFLKTGDELPALMLAMNGQREISLDGVDYVVSRASCDAFTLYHFTPYQQFFGSLMQYGTLALLVLFGCVLLAIPLSLLLARSAYRPVKNVFIQLVSRLDDAPTSNAPMNELEKVSSAIVHIYETMDAYRQDMDASALRACLITGLTREADGISIHQYLGGLRYHRLVLIGVPDAPASVQRATDIAGSYLNGSCRATSVSTGENTISLVLSADTPIEDETLFRLLDGALLSLEQLMPQTALFAVSPCLTSVSSLHEAYQDAMKRMATSALYARSGRICALADPLPDMPDAQEACVAALSHDQAGFMSALEKLLEQYKPCSAETACEQLALISVRIQQRQSVLPLHSADTLPLFSEECRAFRAIRSHTALMDHFLATLHGCDTLDQDGKHLAEASAAYIADHFSDSALGASDVADALHVSVSHFSRVLKKYTGQTFLEMVMACRMGKAKQLLTSAPDLSINALSQACGFNSPSYFTASFKKWYGVTPSEYRSRSTPDSAQQMN